MTRCSAPLSREKTQTTFWWVRAKSIQADPRKRENSPKRCSEVSMALFCWNARVTCFVTGCSFLHQNYFSEGGRWKTSSLALQGSHVIAITLWPGVWFWNKHAPVLRHRLRSICRLGAWELRFSQAKTKPVNRCQPLIRVPVLWLTPTARNSGLQHKSFAFRLFLCHP